MKKMKRNNVFWCWILVWVTFVSWGQEADTQLPKGNDAFSEKKYAEAEALYRESAAKNPKKAAASYNLGTSIYKQKQGGEAKFKFLQAAENAKTKAEKHKAFHNLGNALMLEKKYDLAERAYKDALRNNPRDEETRYNYALAKKMNKENPPPEDGGKKKDDKSQQKEKNQRPDDSKGNQKNKSQEDKPENKSGQNQEPDPQPRPSGNNKQRIDNLLDAVNNEEKKVQLKRKEKSAQTAPGKPEKDW
jgi:hypothetical protein